MSQAVADTEDRAPVYDDVPMLPMNSGESVSGGSGELVSGGGNMRRALHGLSLVALILIIYYMILLISGARGERTGSAHLGRKF